MYRNSIKNFIYVLFVIIFFSHRVSAKNSNLNQKKIANNFKIIKEQVIDLTLMNKRQQAIELIDNEIKYADNYKKKNLLNLKFNTLNEFLSLNSQEAYETGLSSIYQNKKKAQKNIEKCLLLEPDNLQCQWLELKFFKKYNYGQFEEKAEIYLKSVKQDVKSQLLYLSLLINLKLAIKPEQLSILNNKSNKFEDHFLNLLIKYKIAINSKNYDNAKLIIKDINVITKDYPDSIFMNYEILKLTEIDSKNLDSLLDIYKKKCADLPKNIIRKYIFDINLCNRSLN